MIRGSGPICASNYGLAWSKTVHSHQAHGPTHMHDISAKAANSWQHALRSWCLLTYTAPQLRTKATIRPSLAHNHSHNRGTCRSASTRKEKWKGPHRELSRMASVAGRRMMRSSVLPMGHQQATPSLAAASISRLICSRPRLRAHCRSSCHIAHQIASAA